MTETTSFPFRELSPASFQRLVAELLAAEDPTLEMRASGPDGGIDAVGTRRGQAGERRVAIEVSHRLAFNPASVYRFIEITDKSKSKFDELVFVTSADVPKPSAIVPKPLYAPKSGAQLKVIDRSQVEDLLRNHPEIASRYFKGVTQIVRKRKASIWLGLGGLAVSAFAIGFAILPASRPHDSGIDAQVQSVEESLARLRDLESNLQTLKTDLQSKATESARVNKEYVEAMKLKSITADQLEQIRIAVNTQSRSDVIWSTLWGFVLGVAGSMLATVIMETLKRRKELSQ